MDLTSLLLSLNVSDVIVPLGELDAYELRAMPFLLELCRIKNERYE
jgi:hypothetical protein